MAPDLESAKVKARSLFDTLNMPQNPDGLRILDQDGRSKNWPKSKRGLLQKAKGASDMERGQYPPSYRDRSKIQNTPPRRDCYEPRGAR